MVVVRIDRSKQLFFLSSTLQYIFHKVDWADAHHI